MQVPMWLNLIQLLAKKGTNGIALDRWLAILIIQMANLNIVRELDIVSTGSNVSSNQAHTTP